MQKWQCRVAPSLGSLEDTPENIWGIDDSPFDEGMGDHNKPCVFFGLYGLPDFYALWRYKGEKHILWAGSDIRHLQNHYWLEDGGGIQVDNKGICEWINKYCTNWCENQVEANALMKLGIYAHITPSFLGDINQFQISYKPSERPKVYTSVSGDNFKMYGWDKILKLAVDNQNIEFHCYGNTRFPFGYSILDIYAGQPIIPENVILHGRVPKEQMNEEIKDMQGALRLTEFDGFSEILAKSVLMGQWPVSLIEYPHVLKLSELGELKNKKEPNIEGRNYYLSQLNKYPWNQK